MLTRPTAACLLLIALVSSTPAHAAEEPLAVGDTATGVTLTSLGGDSIDLGEVYAEGKTVLVVLRGYPGNQCPACLRQVGTFRAKAAEFAQAGVRVVLVYPGEVANLDQRADEFVGDAALPEPLLMVLDPDYELTNAYGLRWDAPRETAYPSTFVLAPGGEVTWAKISDTHGGRVTAEEALAAATE